MHKFDEATATPNKGTVEILFGMPGSGKSTYCRGVLATANDKYTVAVHNTDSYLYEDDGSYSWTPARMRAAHKSNFKAFKESISKGVFHIIVDNTNLAPKEWTKYVNMALIAGYSINLHKMPVITPKESFERNIHNVPMESLERMYDKLTDTLYKDGVCQK